MMKKITFYLVVSFLFVSVISFAQGTITGTITDDDLGGPLSGANVIEDGTDNGTITDFDGTFTLAVDGNSGTISISYLGYSTNSVEYTLANGSANLGSIILITDTDALAEIVLIGTGIIDLAEDRKTPVAVSTITAKDIQLRSVGNVEFGEAMKNTPSVYAANQIGGFGDGQVFLRGFDDSNTAYLLNGQPINSVEDGRIFWSNWSGMADVANAIQIQRGLGSSKLAISSVGGTVNIVSKTTSRKEGGFVRFMAGNDSYFKGTAAYDSGVNDKGWAFSFLIDHWQGYRKYAIGTEGQGQNYLVSVGYKPNDTHSFNFLLTGAPQRHDQNFSNDLEDFDEYGEKYNGNTGFLNGERFTERRNFYHKPIANLNWDFKISGGVELSTVLYGSWGRGGGTGMLGRGSRIRKDNGEIDFDQIVANNIEMADENGIGLKDDSRVRRASMNNHNWYGLLSNLKFEADENWTFNVGIDGRLYHGDHFRQLNDLLGLNGYDGDRPDDLVVTATFEADPWSTLFDFASDDERVAYNYSEDINNIGGFGQVEYATDRFSAFVQGAFSSQSFQREGHFDGLGEDSGKSEKVNKTGYNVKGGLSFNIAENHAIFANAGMYSRQPFLDNLFESVRFSNTLASPEVDNEEILGFEAGYRFQNGNWKINVDVYRTEWGNRFLAAGGEIEDSEGGTIDVTDRYTDITQIHKGFETDVQFRPNNGKLNVHFYSSIGNWKYDGETPFTTQNDDTGEIIDSGNVDLTGTKVGSSPQTSLGVGLSFDICNSLTIDGAYNIYADHYGFVNVQDVIDAAENDMTYQAERLPAYTLADAGLTYTFKLGENNLVFRGNVYNLFNEAYINQRDAFGYYLGQGRTYNVSLRYNF